MKTSALTIRLDRTLERQLVAAFAARGLCPDVFRTVVAEHELVLGDVILTELRRVLKTKLRLPEDRVAAVDAVLAAFPVTPKPEHPSPIEIRDPTDRWILATAVAGCADVLVTGAHRSDAEGRLKDPEGIASLMVAPECSGRRPSSRPTHALWRDDAGCGSVGACSD